MDIIDKEAYEAQEAGVDRLRNRMVEPHRTTLFAMIEQRTKMVRDRLAGRPMDDMLAEMYLIGVDDGHKMSKAVASVDQVGEKRT